jgi:hypothetical protein
MLAGLCTLLTAAEHAIDLYTKQRQSGASIDGRLENIASGLLASSLAQGAHKNVLGLAIETRRLDILERAIVESVSSFSRSDSPRLHPSAMS